VIPSFQALVAVMNGVPPFSLVEEAKEEMHQQKGLHLQPNKKKKFKVILLICKFNLDLNGIYIIIILK
jgi:hypothetical protein